MKYRVKNIDGDEMWIFGEKFHRESGPAFTRANGSKWWCKKGDLHRDGGLPAIVNVNGSVQYWVNGVEIK